VKKFNETRDFTLMLFFFTGDAVFGTQPDDPIENQFEAFSTFLDKLRNSFSPAIEKNNIFIVPGNHDVDRRKVLQAEKEWLNNDRHGLDEIEEALNAGSPDSKQWMSRLEAYRSFLNSYGLTHLSPESPSLIWQHRWHGKEMTVKISGLNSAWSCC
jgi:hypothetical protein